MPLYNDPKYSGDLYGGSGYPATPKIYYPKTDLIDDVMAWHVTGPQKEIVALETELGTDPAGAYSTVKARLDGYKKMIPGFWSSTNWDGDPHSTGTVTSLNIKTEFGLPVDVRAVLVRIVARDSGTWPYTSAENHFCLGPTSGLYYQVICYPLGGDVWTTSGAAILNVSGGNTVYYHFQASGTDTLDVWMEIYGYWAL